MLNMYHTSKDVLTQVEVEKRGTEIGVVRSSVLEVNQALVDDGLVDMEKIGSTCYFWLDIATSIFDRIIQNF